MNLRIYIKKYKTLKPFIQFIKFGIIGLFNTIISQCITYGLIFLGKRFIITVEEISLIILSSFIGFSISMLNSYYWNNKFVFKKSNSNNLKTFFKSYISYGISWLLASAITFLFTNISKIPVLWIPLISLTITVPLNFFANKFWAFK